MGCANQSGILVSRSASILPASTRLNARAAAHPENKAHTAATNIPPTETDCAPLRKNSFAVNRTQKTTKTDRTICFREPLVVPPGGTALSHYLPETHASRGSPKINLRDYDLSWRSLYCCRKL